MKLSKSLAPLEPLKKKINVINGLFNKPATGQGIHPAQTGNLLRARRSRRAPCVHAGISVDQVLANRIGQDTLQPSMVLACEQPMTGYHETNFSMAYSSHISWQSADSPVPNEVYPSLAFDSLFENRGSLRNQSILDRVRDAAQSAEPPDQRDRQGEAGRVPDQRARSGEARRGHAEEQGQGRGPREAEEPAGARRWSGRRTACRKISASTRG